MELKSILLIPPMALIILLASCSKTDSDTSDPTPDPNPTDTTGNPGNPGSNGTLTYPTKLIFKSTLIPEIEYYQVMASENKKVSEPYYMRNAKTILGFTIKDDHSMPFKEIVITSKDKLNIVYKDGSLIENYQYTLKNNNDLFLNVNGYLGSFTPDKKVFNLNLAAYSVSNDGNRPIFPRLYLNGSYSPDKNQTISYLISSQSLNVGDTLAINFAQMIYEKQ